MKKDFLTLSNAIINKCYIVQIQILPRVYTIYMHGLPSAGGFLVYGSGYFSSKKCIHVVREADNKPDYDAITKFINDT